MTLLRGLLRPCGSRLLDGILIILITTEMISPPRLDRYHPPSDHTHDHVVGYSFSLFEQRESLLTHSLRLFLQIKFIIQLVRFPWVYIVAKGLSCECGMVPFKGRSILIKMPVGHSARPAINRLPYNYSYTAVLSP